jgi:hypothetical protein
MKDVVIVDNASLILASHKASPKVKGLNRLNCTEREKAAFMTKVATIDCNCVGMSQYERQAVGMHVAACSF